MGLTLPAPVRVGCEAGPTWCGLAVRAVDLEGTCIIEAACDAVDGVGDALDWVDRQTDLVPHSFADAYNEITGCLEVGAAMTAVGPEGTAAGCVGGALAYKKAPYLHPYESTPSFRRR